MLLLLAAFPQMSLSDESRFAAILLRRFRWRGLSRSGGPAIIADRPRAQRSRFCVAIDRRAMAETARSSAGSLLYDPQGQGLWLSGAAGRRAGRAASGRAGYNAYVNMQARGIPMGFGFWDQTAGFDISQTLIPYSSLSTYGRAFWVGLTNTALVAAISIALATPLGFAIGVARLSPNWILAKIALVYVEIMRNTPLLLQLAVLVQRGTEGAARAPPVAHGRSAWSSSTIAASMRRAREFARRRAAGSRSPSLAGIVGALAYRLRARRRQALTGRAGARRRWSPRCLCLGLPAVAYFAAGRPVEFRPGAPFRLQPARRRADPARTRRADFRPCRPTPPGSSPRSCAPACWRSRAARAKRRARSACAAA